MAVEIDGCWDRCLAFGFRRLAFGGFQLLRLKIFGGFWGCGLLDFKGCLVVVVVGHFASGGLWDGWLLRWVVAVRLRFGGGSDLVGQGECVVEIWWWLRFCDGGGWDFVMVVKEEGGWVLWFGRGRPEVMAGGVVAREMGVERKPQIRKIGRKRERARM